jgi:hypothetical protein
MALPSLEDGRKPEPSEDGHAGWRYYTLGSAAEEGPYWDARGRVRLLRESPRRVVLDVIFPCRHQPLRDSAMDEPAPHEDSGSEQLHENRLRSARRFSVSGLIAVLWPAEILLPVVPVVVQEIQAFMDRITELPDPVSPRLAQRVVPRARLLAEITLVSGESQTSIDRRLTIGWIEVQRRTQRRPLVGQEFAQLDLATDQAPQRLRTLLQGCAGGHRCGRATDKGSQLGQPMRSGGRSGLLESLLQADLDPVMMTRGQSPQATFSR